MKYCTLCSQLLTCVCDKNIQITGTSCHKTSVCAVYIYNRVCIIIWLNPESEDTLLLKILMSQS